MTKFHVLAICLVVVAALAMPHGEARSIAAACETPFRSARTVDIAPLEFPDEAAQAHITTAVATVKVTISATGALESATILTSSGNGAIDAAAVKAARGSTYAAEIRNCVPVRSVYSFRANFDNSTPAPTPFVPAPMPAPTFSPPSGWKPSEYLVRKATDYQYGAWSKGRGFLFVSAYPSAPSLGAIQQKMVEMLKFVNAKVAVNQVERICPGGTQDALVMAWARQTRDGKGDLYVDVYELTSKGQYQVSYYAPGSQGLDPAVVASIKSFCAPPA